MADVISSTFVFLQYLQIQPVVYTTNMRSRQFSSYNFSGRERARIIWHDQQLNKASSLKPLVKVTCDFMLLQQLTAFKHSPAPSWKLRSIHGMIFRCFPMVPHTEIISPGLFVSFIYICLLFKFSNKSHRKATLVLKKKWFSAIF